MGGYGSGFSGQAKHVTDSSRKLRINDVNLTPGHSGVLYWTRGNESCGAARCFSGHGRVELDYTVDGVRHRYWVAVERQARHFGGTQAYWLCPKCQRRCSALYCPPTASRFLCRQCHDLTYASCQESHKFARLLIGQMRMSPDEARQVEMLLRRKLNT